MTDTTVSTLDRLNEHIVGVRRVVDWLKAHPELADIVRPSVIDTGGMHAYVSEYDVEAGANFATAVRALMAGAPIGTVRKVESDQWTKVIRDFGGMTLELYTSRAVTCEQVVVGTEPDEVELPACPECGGIVEETPTGYLTCREHGSDHYRAKPLGTRTHVIGERPVYGWECAPILADHQAEEVAV